MIKSYRLVFIVCSSSLLFIISCTPAKKIESTSIMEITGEEILKGSALIEKSDCFTCHKKEERLIGPAFLQVAQRYSLTEPNIERLANKILSGGSGSWGQLPMLPHTNLNKNEAELIVKYILSLNKTNQK